MHFTVAIPTYNGADRLPSLLEALRHQRVSSGTRWEIIVVDNNSTDETAAVVRTYQTTQPPDVPLRYVLEQRQGAAHARQRAVEMAEGAWVGFLDDDNIPTDHWVATALGFSRDRPRLGAIASRICGRYEVEPPPGFERIQQFLAIHERGQTPKFFDPDQRVLPPSAGLVVRRQAWLDCVPRQLVLGGRTAKSMLTSEDLETLIYLQQGGWELWYAPGMEIDHLIPAWRMGREYLVPFFRGIGLTKYVIRMMRIPPVQRPLWTVAYAISDLRRWLGHRWHYRRSLGHDPVVDGEQMLYWSSFVSPWVMGRHLRQQRRSRDRAAAMGTWSEASR